MSDPRTTRNGEHLLLEEPCMACNREAGWLMCELCEQLTVAEMFPAKSPEPVKS